MKNRMALIIHHSSLCTLHFGCSPAPLVNQRGDEARPAGLVRSAEAHARVAVEVFVEEYEVAPVRVVLEFSVPAVHGPAPFAVAREDAYEPVGEATRHLVELHARLAGDGAFDRELLAVSLAELSQRFNHHEGGREPDGAAPV